MYLQIRHILDMARFDRYDYELFNYILINTVYENECVCNRNL